MGVGAIKLKRGPACQRAASLDKGADGEQHAADIGMFDDRDRVARAIGAAAL